MAIENIWIVGESLGEDIDVDSSFGGDGDIIIDKAAGTIQQKENGTWAQIYP